GAPPGVPADAPARQRRVPRGLSCADEVSLGDSKGPLHLLPHCREPLESAAADFRRGPSSKPDVVQRLPHLVPWQVPFADVREPIHLAAEPLHVQLHAAVGESPNPLARLSILPMIPNVVVHTDPRAAKTV